MKHVKYIMAALSALLLCTEAISQNLDPTLEVSRTYIAGGMDFGKSSIEMSVPDSLLKFNADFEYSVFNKPYQGAYEFNPYVLDLHPEAAGQRKTSFFLRAGAGVALHPVGDIVVSPRFGKAPFTMNIYGNHRSYFGVYREISNVGGILKWDGQSHTRYEGHESRTRAGVDGRVDWKKGFFTFDMGYTGYADKDTLHRRFYNEGKIVLRAASKNGLSNHFYYDATLGYRYAGDRIWYGGNTALPQPGGRQNIVLHNTFLNCTIGPEFSPVHAFMMDICAEFSFYEYALDGYSGKFALTPRYGFSRGKWDLSLGARVAVFLVEDRLDITDVRYGIGQVIYPDVRIDFKAVKNYLDIYLNITGGGDNFAYERLLEKNIHFSPLYANDQRKFMVNTVERVRATLGLKGNIASKFFFDLNGGYARYSNLLCDAVRVSSGLRLPSIDYADCNYYFASLDMGWKSQDISADVELRYQGTDLYGNKYGVIGLSPFSAKGSVIYNWNKRIYAGIHCNGTLSSKGYVSGTDEAVKIPGYADLGVSAEFYFIRKMSVWLYGGNLLNMTIQRTPLCTEGGLSITAGITVKL